MFTVQDPTTVEMSPSRLARIDAWMTDYVDSGRLAGCTTAVMRKGELTYLKSVGLADPQSGRRVQTDTVFRIYSMTKPIVTAAAMSLQ